MVGAEAPLVNLQGAAHQGLGLRILCAFTQVIPCLIEHYGGLLKFEAIFLNRPSQRLSVRNQSAARSPGRKLNMWKDSVYCTDCAFGPQPLSFFIHPRSENLLNQTMKARRLCLRISL